MTGTTSVGIRFDENQRRLLQAQAVTLGLPLATMLYRWIQTVGNLPPKQDRRRKQQ